ncbi:hypothetical protein TELCIR_06031 [Teladorsagia circumcincta]|uniref:SCP domain-containing protein n=1 Tax=Teladorsagia circumcincta TaxID=45464 RepID=A0A2G9URE5_TELCI|nr:hypothetical protein TELCIR_06031 [Teladorsagia circumcincta]
MEVQQTELEYEHCGTIVILKPPLGNLRRGVLEELGPNFRQEYRRTSLSFRDRERDSVDVRLKLVGCYVQPCANNRWTVVCHYRPGGNIVHNRVYTEGRPCSACPIGTFCNPNKLCA